MVKEYKPPRLINALMKWMSRRGVGNSAVLTTTGRKSGEPREVAVSPITVGEVEYLVSPYGEVGWVSNARSHPEAQLAHGRSIREVRLVEVEDGAEAVRAYHAREKFPRSYMDVPDDPTTDDIRSSSQVFPVFEVHARL